MTVGNDLMTHGSNPNASNCGILTVAKRLNTVMITVSHIVPAIGHSDIGRVIKHTCADADDFSRPPLTNELTPG